MTKLDWPALVAEARARRAALGLTQRELAELAQVSIATVVRFERGEAALRLASALAVLEVLGMTTGS